VGIPLKRSIARFSGQVLLAPASPSLKMMLSAIPDVGRDADFQRPRRLDGGCVVKGFLLDTNVLSELRKGARADASVRRWFEGIDANLLFSERAGHG